MWKLIKKTINTKKMTRTLQQESLNKPMNSLFGRSLHIRHLDSGSCNGCDFELTNLNNVFYDLQQYGIDFVASPRHADLLAVTGGVTRHLLKAVHETYQAAPDPKLVVAVGECACNGGKIGSHYAVIGGVEKVIPVNVYISGCPPTPEEIIQGFLKAVKQHKS